MYPVNPVTGEVDFANNVWAQIEPDGSMIYDDGTRYNYAPVNYFQRPDETYTLGAFANYEVSEAVKPFVEVMYMRNRTVAQIAESGTFFAEQYLLDYNNPLVPANVNSFIQQGFVDNYDSSITDPYDPANITQYVAFIGKRNVEGGGRQDQLTHDSFRIAVGSEGYINDNWSYETSYMFGSTTSSTAYINDFFAPNIGPAIGALDSSGNPLPCTASTCLDYPVWTPIGQPGAITSEQANALQGTAVMTGITSTAIANAFVAGEIDFTLPTANSPIQAVVGIEHRQEKFERVADSVFSEAQLLGQGGATVSIAGGYSTLDVFGEFIVPLVEDAAFAEMLDLELGFRASDYNIFGRNNIWKAAINWVPLDGYKVRASFNKAIRVPNIGELFAPQSTGLWGGTDPCAGATPVYSQAECANTGVTASQYGNISQSPASQYNGIFGGSPELQPEEAETFTFGIVGNPFDNFDFTIDYWTIDIDEVIGTVGAQTIVEQCAETGNAIFCDAINRGPSGSLWLGSDNFVRSVNVNLATQTTSGVDISMNYRQEIWDGMLNVGLIGTKMVDKDTNSGLGDPTVRCVEFVDQDCFATPEWRHVLNATYSVDDWSVGARWRYMGKVYNRESVDLIAPEINAFNYIDVNASYVVTEGVVARFGINNLADKEPPLVGNALSTNANTVAGFYDTLGRYLFLNVTATF
jgi:outer membrane receptor protein involved in Fe transport